VLALIHVPFPFDGDQAMFTVFAHAMRHGDRLYVDLWDVKQPGIFLFYLASGSLFGFREVGVHVGALLWALATAVCVQRALRDRVAHGWVADVAPLLTVGAFYLAAGPWDLTQIEELVALPLLVCLWAAADAGDDPRRRRNWMLVSGVAASAVAYFKLVYVPIAFAMWVCALRADTSRSPAERRRDAGALFVGFVGPLVPLLLFFVHEHLVGTMWWTYVTHPPAVARHLAPAPASRLTDGITHFLQQFAWLLALAVGSGAAVGIRRGARRLRLPADPFVAGVALWFAFAWLTIIVQNQWRYLFMLAVVPLGLLAAIGLDRLVTVYRNGQLPGRAVRVIAGATALLAIMPLMTLGHAVNDLAANDFALTASARARFRVEVGGYYRTALADADWVRAPGRTPGAIHVEGNPLIQYLSGRPMALRENGWAPDQSDARLWRWTREELRADRPVYLFVDDVSLPIMATRSPETVAVVDALYCRADRTTDGEWYALAGSADCADR
jgi:hypothetical protein